MRDPGSLILTRGVSTELGILGAAKYSNEAPWITTLLGGIFHPNLFY